MYMYIYITNTMSVYQYENLYFCRQLHSYNNHCIYGRNNYSQ
jgi:hypothetical protein